MSDKIKEFLLKEVKKDAANMLLIQKTADDTICKYDEFLHDSLTELMEDELSWTLADTTLINYVAGKFGNTKFLDNKLRKKYLTDPYVKMLSMSALSTEYYSDLELSLLKVLRNDAIETGDYLDKDGVFIPNYRINTKPFFVPALISPGDELNDVEDDIYDMLDYKCWKELQNHLPKAEGKVLVLNDIMGYMTYMSANMDTVTEVVVLVSDNDSREFINRYVIKKCKNKHKITVLDKTPSEYVGEIKKNEYDYIFANICKYADIDDYIVRRKLKDNGIKCDYFMENHLMRDITSTVRIILAERFGFDDEYFENRQALVINKEKSEMEREQYMEDMYSDAFANDYLDFEGCYEESADDDWHDEEMANDMACAIEAYVKDLVEESMFEVDLVRDILSCVEINSVEDIKKVTSTEFLKELI